MTNENDINVALREINQKMLVNKKKIDIDNIVESILLFFNNYFNTLSDEVVNKVISLKSFDNNDSSKEIVSKLVLSFFNILENKLKDTCLNKFNSIKNDVSKLSDNECNKKLNYIASIISNQISDYYLDNAHDLINELNNDDDNKNISDYILKIVYNRVINTLKDRLMYGIKVIDNNYEENNLKLENINEKTISKV